MTRTSGDPALEEDNKMQKRTHTVKHILSIPPLTTHIARPANKDTCCFLITFPDCPFVLVEERVMLIYVREDV